MIKITSNDANVVMTITVPKDDQLYAKVLGITNIDSLFAVAKQEMHIYWKLNVEGMTVDELIAEELDELNKVWDNKGNSTTED